MKPAEKFLKQPKSFWAYVRSISQHVGYTDRATSGVKIPTISAMAFALGELKLRSDAIHTSGKPSELGQTLLDYFKHRADAINNEMQHNLMNAEQAKALYEELKAKNTAAFKVTMNKQKGEKAKPAYLTAMVGMLVSANSGGLPVDLDPRELTAITKDGLPVRTLARRVDGAFPNAINPVAIWEIKEYYWTTTFGSRVADGVYETLLDGMELEELRESEKIDVKHVLILDAHYTWWTCGRSYLCRIVDMLHMGYVDEVLVGREIVDRIPALTQEWVDLVKNSKVGKEAQKTGGLL